MARALSETSPSPARLALTWIPQRAPWLIELQRQWPGGPAWLRRGRPSELLTIEGPLTSAEWLASRSRSLRSDLLRLRRRRSEAGFELTVTESHDRVRADLAALAGLHQARFNNRSQWLTAGVEEVLAQAGEQLVSEGGFRLWKILYEGKMVAGTVFARAGDATELLLTSFDPAWGKFGVGIGSIVAGIEDELDTGSRRIHLGPGQFQYLRLLANTRRPSANYELFPTNRRTIRARAHWLPEHARDRANIWRVQLRLGRRLRAARQLLQTTRARR